MPMHLSTCAQHQEDKKTAQANAVERQNNFGPRVFRLSANGWITIRDHGSGTGLMSAVFGEAFIIHRVESVTACLQAGIPLTCHDKLPASQ